MKKVALISTALVAGLLFSATSAMAAPHRGGHAGVNTYQLERSIDAGVRSGKLVKWEERQLRSELYRLKRAVKNANRDRRVTRFERSSLERKEASLKYHISKLMNNREVARSFHRNDRRGNNSHSWSNNSRNYSRSTAPAPRNHR